MFSGATFIGIGLVDLADEKRSDYPCHCHWCTGEATVLSPKSYCASGDLRERMKPPVRPIFWLCCQTSIAMKTSLRKRWSFSYKATY